MSDSVSSPEPAAIQVAIVEDEPVLRDELCFQLGHRGFSAVAFENAAQFYRHLAVQEVSVAVLDIGLDGEDGLSICRHLRAHDPGLGVVFLTARALRDDRLAGLSAGADSYLSKPVDIDELELILRRLGERAARATPATAQPAGDWRLDVRRALLLTPSQTTLRLSVSEVDLLRAQFAANGAACPHTTLAAAMGISSEEFDKHRIEVIVSRLRARVQRDTGLRLPVTAVRGLGYRFDS